MMATTVTASIGIGLAANSTGMTRAAIHFMGSV